MTEVLFLHDHVSAEHLLNLFTTYPALLTHRTACQDHPENTAHSRVLYSETGQVAGLLRWSLGRRERFSASADLGTILTAQLRALFRINTFTALFC